MIRQILSPALKLWLYSQVEQVEGLELIITGSDRQILSGYVPQVTLATSYAVYQGLHLGKIQLQGENIRVNLGQVIKGKPLRLLEAIFLTGQVLLDEAQLQASLSTPLLSEALTELLSQLLVSSNDRVGITIAQSSIIKWNQVRIDTDKVNLQGSLIEDNQSVTSFIVSAGLSLSNGSLLKLDPLIITGLSADPDLILEPLVIDLGSDVAFDTLSLTKGELLLAGEIKINP